MEVINIMYFAAWILYKKNRVNKTTVTTFLWLAIMDICLYFYNYKLSGFGLVYFWFTGFWLLTYYCNYLWNKIKVL